MRLFLISSCDLDLPPCKHVLCLGTHTSTLTPASARALICCSVAVMGLSVCAEGESWIDSSGSAGVTDEVDLRGGMLDFSKELRQERV